MYMYVYCCFCVPTLDFFIQVLHNCSELCRHYEIGISIIINDTQFYCVT